MSYRLPVRTTTACSTTGCAASTSWSDSEPGARADGLAGWELGPETAACPAHTRRASVLAFAA